MTEIPKKSFPESPKHYDFLDGIRGLAAFYVMIYHFCAYRLEVPSKWIRTLQSFFSFGHSAVALFIVLSGFSLMLPVVRSTDGRLRGGVRAYLYRRCRRILPGYFPALLLSIVVTAATSNVNVSPVPDRLSLFDVGLHCLLLHNLLPTTLYTINITHWSVAAEWDIYFIFAFVLLPCWRIAGSAVTVAIAFCIAAVPMLFFPRAYNFSWTCPWYIGLFATGMAAAAVGSEKLNRIRVVGLAIFAIFAAGIYGVLHRTMLSPLRHDYHKVTFVSDAITGVIVACGLLIGVANARGQVRLPFLHILETRPLRFLGSISYSLYLLHAAVLSIFVWIILRLNLDAISSFWLRSVAGSIASLVLAAIFARYFERPFLNPRQTN